MALNQAKVLISIVAACAAWAAEAEVRLASIFQDHMVVQRDGVIPVWGWAAEGEEVTVHFAGKSVTATPGAAGRWTAQLAPTSAGGPYTLVVEGTNTVTVSDVLVGEVWLCSGQSNMAMNVRGAMNAEQEAAAADYPQIRMATLARKTAREPKADCELKEWVVCSPQTVPAFSATAYYFGRHVHRDLGVPVGLINASWGGTCVEAWTSKKALQRIPSGRELFEQYMGRIEAYDPGATKAAYEKQLEAWPARVKTAKEAGRKPPRKPSPPVDPADDQNHPSNLYNSMIAPLVPYAIRGTIWYQGERNSNAVKDAYDYRFELPALITDWRDAWGRGDFPFLFVQLPNFGGKQPDALALNRESMLHTMQTVPNTGMAVTIDVGDTKDIHPKNKQAVGERLGIAAMKLAYGADIVPFGPIFRSMTVTGSQAVLTFDHVGDGLEARHGDLREFVMAGEDRTFVVASADVTGPDTVTVSADGIEQPVAVRYAWTSDPKCNLFSKGGLPATPFRTDTWQIPGQTGEDPAQK